MKHQSKLVRFEFLAVGAARLQISLQVLDPILTLSTATVLVLVNYACCHRSSICDYKACVSELLFSSAELQPGSAFSPRDSDA
jgi:hypothetical protein